MFFTTASKMSSPYSSCDAGNTREYVRLSNVILVYRRRHLRNELPLLQKLRYPISLCGEVGAIFFAGRGEENANVGGEELGEELQLSVVGDARKAEVEEGFAFEQRGLGQQIDDNRVHVGSVDPYPGVRLDGYECAAAHHHPEAGVMPKRTAFCSDDCWPGLRRQRVGVRGAF